MLRCVFIRVLYTTVEYQISHQAEHRTVLQAPKDSNKKKLDKKFLLHKQILCRLSCNILSPQRCCFFFAKEKLLFRKIVSFSLQVFRRICGKPLKSFRILSNKVRRENFRQIISTLVGLFSQDAPSNGIGAEQITARQMSLGTRYFVSRKTPG